MAGAAHPAGPRGGGRVESLWRDLVEARTPEEAARRRFGLWALGALIVLLPFWWWLGADATAWVLRPVLGLVLKLFGLTGEIRVLDSGDWVLGTRLHRPDGQAYWQPISHENIRRMMVGVPIYLAFLIAPPRAERPVRALGLGLLALAVVYFVSMALVAWGQMAPLLNPALAATPPALRLMEAPLHPMAAQVVLVGRYVGLTVAPLVAAIIAWAILNPKGRDTLLGGLDETPADTAP